MIIPSNGVSIDSLKGLCKRMRDLNPDADLSAQALCKRINDVSSSRLMKGVLHDLIGLVHKELTNICPKLASALSPFNRVILQDSTVVTLNEKLEDSYKEVRRGNNCIKSQVKIDLIYDLSKGVLIDADLFQGNEPDQSLAKRMIRLVEPNDLIIRDLGYFSLKALKLIAQNNAYFLSRLKACVNFYSNEDDSDPLDFENYLKQISPDQIY